jgi:hypothetical protein
MFHISLKLPGTAGTLQNLVVHGACGKMARISYGTIY